MHRLTLVTLHIACLILPGDAAKSGPVVVSLLLCMNHEHVQLLHCYVSSYRDLGKGFPSMHLRFHLVNCQVHLISSMLDNHVEWDSGFSQVRNPAVSFAGRLYCLKRVGRMFAADVNKTDSPSPRQNHRPQNNYPQ